MWPRRRSRAASTRDERAAPALERAPGVAVVVYHAQSCHLCERALEQVRALREELGFELTEVDIGGDELLESAYREWIPVVEIDGRRRFTYHVQPDAFRRAVAQAAASD
ncbi:MAG TPA: glutaredoxin family protein [Gaiellaceae bacterium]|nr:glutaredoxin family protein [Gaiellaceae bacterium]